MPKRQMVQHVLSDAVMGKGSWVDFRRMTVAESKAIRASSEQHAGDESWAETHSVQLLADHIVNWNWVDENDAALPLPKDDPTVIDRLTDLELNFLNNLFKPPTDPNS